ncbi:MAG: tRNA adenosine(34) deaminase TadA [Clostridiales bacterium]|jgi:tRNA(adenine34) deaminase|nr:tRNA adenosine(34) deaminase TadA [Clostridiales bacterium]
MDNFDEKFMRHALGLARRAKARGEVPVGCVIVRAGQIIGAGYNLRNTGGNTLYHAEILAINRACRRLGDWRLDDCTIYVTLEPCPMCAGAILQARLPRLVFGAKNPKAGAAGSLLNLLDDGRFNHKVSIVEGVLQEECSALVKEFFASLRKA